MKNLRICLFSRGFNDLVKIQGSKHDKSFFFYPQKTINENNEENKKLIEQLIDECEKLARQCDELKVNHTISCYLLMIELIYCSYYQNQNRQQHQVRQIMKKVRIEDDFKS
jgi:uncharacterized cysteine cluster protein YcgN (CxxCxxCC family)